MIIIVPRTKRDVQLLIRDLQQFSLEKLLSDLRETEVLLELPRFSIEYDVDLSPALQSVSNRISL